MKEIVLDLMCDLGNDEVNDRAQQLSSTISRNDEVDAEKRASAKHYAEQLNALGGQIRKLSGVIRQRAESRPVACAVLFHSPSTGTKRIVRKDTGEVVRDEAMSQFEMQNNLFEDCNLRAGGERLVEDIAADVERMGAEQQVLTVIAAAGQKQSKRKKKAEPDYRPEPGQQ